MSKELVNVLQESDMSLCQKIMELDDLEEVRAAKSTQSLGGRVVLSASKTLVSCNCLTFVLICRVFWKFAYCTLYRENTLCLLYCRLESLKNCVVLQGPAAGRKRVSVKQEFIQFLSFFFIYIISVLCA